MAKRLFAIFVSVTLLLVGVVYVASAQEQDPEFECPPSDGVCWLYDHDQQTMTWYGATDGSCDIHQATGEPLDMARAGYAISVTTEVTMSLVGFGTIDGEPIDWDGGEGVIVPPGSHSVKSPGDSGGVRLSPLSGFGWKADLTTPSPEPTATVQLTLTVPTAEAEAVEAEPIQATFMQVLPGLLLAVVLVLLVVFGRRGSDADTGDAQVDPSDAPADADADADAD